MLRNILTLSLLWAFSMGLLAQNTRIKDHNNIAWLTSNINWKWNARWSLHLEYQWRRADFVNRWQQGLLRGGINYQANPKLLLRAGYAWAETFPYGEYPLNALGKDFTEHRSYQMANLSDKLGRFDLSHRFMLEQRWIGRYSSKDLVQEDEFVFSNRLRYMFRLQCPLKGRTLDDREFYVAAYDEILIGFGKNVNENVFDQNRLGMLLGYRWNKRWRMEAGFLNQIVQLSREVTLPGESSGRNVFQHNSGIVVNTFLNLQRGK